jgi:hypothetical protein
MTAAALTSPEPEQGTACVYLSTTLKCLTNFWKTMSISWAYMLIVHKFAELVEMSIITKNPYLGVDSMCHGMACRQVDYPTILMIMEFRKGPNIIELSECHHVS